MDCVGGITSCAVDVGGSIGGAGGTTGGITGVAQVQMVHHLSCLIIILILPLTYLIQTSLQENKIYNLKYNLTFNQL